MADFYPPVSFHFKVTFEGLTEGPNTELDTFFQSIAGLDSQIETENIKEGGLNRFEHVVPTRVKSSDLVLKRGKLLSAQSGLTNWCKKAFENFEFNPVNITVTLLDEEHAALMVWNVVHALPKSWKMSELNAEKGEVLIETLELSYNYVTYT